MNENLNNEKYDKVNLETIIEEKHPLTTISLSEWVVTLLLLSIPIVGFIMLFVYAFSKKTPLSKSNYAKAVLIFSAIWLVLYWIYFMFIFSSL